MSDINYTAQQILDTALRDVKQELAIIDGDDVIIVYIHDVVINNDGAVNIKWSCPFTLEPQKKEEVLNHVNAAIKAQIEELKKECLSNKASYRIWSAMKNIFSKLFRI